jgi:nucleoside-diphosphate-sugar epimerase
MSEKLAVFGASGFIGSALCERLFFHEDYDFTAFIRSAGNAAGIARMPIEMKSVDLLNAAQLRNALNGFDVVVNCSRGPAPVMIYGLKNLIKSAKKSGVRKFIHISSISIYGLSQPLPPTTDETAPPKPDSGYGAMKLKQDGMVFETHQSGLPSVILCPSIIYGPFSLYILGLSQSLRSQQAQVVDEGKHAANLVHVYNLVEAILAAIRCDDGAGERYFVNDPNPPTWKVFYENLQALLGINDVLPSISRAEALKALAPEAPQREHRFSDNIKILFSGEFRRALSMIPAFKAVNDFAANLFNRLSPETQAKFRHKLEKPAPVAGKETQRNLNPEFLRAQIRRNYFSSEKLARELNYKPTLDYTQGLETLKSWLRFAGVI